MVSALALTAALGGVAPAVAAEAAAEAKSANIVELDAVVVTAATSDKTKLKSSMSVNSISTEQINEFTPRSPAEVLRMVPGLNVQDTTGPGGNSNIGVRGIPVITGGSEFVQIQEDGLPTVLFGDMNFGNNDYWTRFDSNVKNVEAVRGGGSSTFASQAPGAVINYITDTGEKPGGSIGVSKGLNYNETQVDFGYNGRINESTRYHIGGFVRDGNGPTHIPFNAEEGYQIKANITHEFDDNKGYIRFNLKRLDDKEPTYTGAPTIAALSGNRITGFSVLPGFDARSGTNLSILNQSFQTLNNNGTLGTTAMDGIHSKSTSVGVELHYKLTSALTVDEKFRWTDQSGVFHTQFTNFVPTSSILGNSLNGINGNIGTQNPSALLKVGSIRYANGPKQGQLFTGAYMNLGPNIDTNMPDMGSLVNDFTVSSKSDFMGGFLNAKAGWFHMTQRVKQDWHINPEFNEATGVNPAQLDLFSTTGVQLTAAGQAGFNNNWGTCCARDYDLRYTDDAVYGGLDFTLGKLDVDASLREDMIRATGTALGGVTGPNVTVSDALGSATLASDVAGGAAENLNYRVNYLSYSFGALYAINTDTSAFVRISRGGRFNGDRRILGGNFNADGSLDAQGKATAVNFVTQQEIGVKRRGSVLGASYTAEVTAFRAQLTDNNYDFTRIQNNLNPVIANVYHSAGAEMNGSVRYGNFSLYGNATLLSSGIVKAGGANVNPPGVPHALPGFTFLIMPSYDIGKAAVGFIVDGQSSTVNNDTNSGSYVRIPGQTFVNLFAKVRPYKGLEADLNINNLFNTLGYRGDGGPGPTYGTNSTIFASRPMLGRTITMSVKYAF